MKLRHLPTVLLALLLSGTAHAFNFSVSALQGTGSLSALTSLQFGPDNRLYVAQTSGQIKIFTVQRTAPNSYSVTATETIDLVKNIPNYDDTGVRNTTLTKRQCTGILVVGTAASPIIYASSSDPRIGGGSGGYNDTGLDTNSGIISRLTQVNGVWTKVDLVRGLPRSEENHATNGLQLDPATNILYVAQGGNTNAGSPSVSFAYACETALSGAILSVDLNAINALPVQTDQFGQQYVYDLPTVDDPNPNRAHNPDGSNVNDPFGGNNGLNQAKLVPGGPVQIYSSGYRNPYDLVITLTAGNAGKIYAFDNGANPGWGGYPQGNGTPSITNQYVSGEPGFVNNLDNLHLVTKGSYAGHPNPIRANPSGAGWFHFDSTMPAGSQMIYSSNPTTDWPPVPVSMANVAEDTFEQPGTANQALLLNTYSTNGITEYVANNFNGGMKGNLIAASFNGDNLLRIALSADGTTVTNGLEVLASNFGSQPLDVTCPSPADGNPFLGTIWVAHYSPSKISILEPADFDNPGGSTCTGVNSWTVDEDGDGYSNADEISNGSDPCNASSRPTDWDGDHLSDKNDPDDDNDGIPDVQDPFPLDPTNGKNVPLNVHYELFNATGIGFYGIGFTGLMMNRGQDYLPLITPDNAVAGGTAGLFTLSSVGGGTPRGSDNTQMDAYQFAYNSDITTPPYVVSSRLAGPFFNSSPTGNQTQGIYIGSGDQDNYVSVALHGNNGAGGIEVVYEVGGTIQFDQIYPLSGIGDLGNIDLSFEVDPVAGTVQPRYQIPQGVVTALGSKINVGGDVLMALMGKMPLAVGLFANTGNGSGPTFTATWDWFDVTLEDPPALAKVTIDPKSTNMATASSYASGSFVIQNLSTGSQQITGVTVDLSTAQLRDMVYDVTGTAGDNVFKVFTQDAKTSGVALQNSVMINPHDGIDQWDGYDALTANFSAFPVNGSFSFSIDVDPNNIKGVAQPGEHDSASVSGLDIIGATATVYFSDGTVQVARMGRVPNSVSGSYGWARADKPSKPGVGVVGQSSPFQASTASQTVRVTGVAGMNVALVDCEAGLYLGGVPNGGYNVHPYEANTVVAVNEVDTTIGSAGYVDIPVTLTQTDAKSGYHFFTATLTDSNGITGPSSDALEIQYVPPASTDTQPPSQPGALTFTNVGSTSVTINWTAATDNVGVTGYRISRGSAVLTTVTTLSYTDSGLTPSTAYTYSVVALDAAGNVSAPTTGTVATIAGILPTTIRINAGSTTSYVDAASNTWAADNGYNTGTVATYTTTVTGTTDPTLYKTERYDPSTAPELQYTLGLQNGSYTVRLYFAETYTGNQAVGKRVFDVNVQGTTAFSGVDIYALAGANKALMLSTTATVSNNQLAIQFIHKVENPKINAIEIIPASTADTTPPTAPTNLAASNVTTTSLTLNWTASTDNVGVTGYQVSRGGTVVGTVTSPTFNDSGLTANTTYSYSVVAVDAAGNTSSAATLNVTTAAAADTQPPTAPGALTFTNVTSTGLTVNWTAATDNVGVTGYQVSRGGTVLGTVTGLTYADSGLTPATSYSYSVVAVDAAGNTSSAATQNVTTAAAADTQPPTAPGALTFTNVTSTGLTVNWTAATDNVGVTGYQVSRGGTVLGTVTGLTYADSGLTPATSYSYSVVAVDAAGNTSTASTGTVATASGTAPTTLRINAGSTTSYVDSNNNTWAADNSFNTGTARSYTTTVTGTSDPALFRTERYDPSAAPELLYTLGLANGSYTVRLYFAETYTGDEAVGARVFDVSIQGATAFSGVDIFSQAGGANKALILSAPATVTNGKLTIQFIHKVENPKINAIEVVPATGGDTTAPSAPGALSTTNVTSTSLTLNWGASTDNVGVTGYRVSRNGTVVGSVTTTSFNDSGLSSGTTYTYSVIALDAAGNISTPTTGSFSTSGGTVVRINAGSTSSYLDTAGNTWSADKNFNTGTVYTYTTTVTGTTDPTLYKTERYDQPASPELQYTIPVTNGNYTVRLYFAETYPTYEGAGLRVFDVNVQGTTAFSGVDIYSQAGGANKALMLSTTATVTNGQLTIQFIHKVQNPKVNAIEILPAP